MSTSFNLQYNNNSYVGPRASQTAVQPQSTTQTANQEKVSSLFISKKTYITTNKEEADRFRGLYRGVREKICKENGWEIDGNVYTIKDKVISVWDRFIINSISGKTVFCHDQIDRKSVVGIVFFQDQLEFLKYYIENVEKFNEKTSKINMLFDLNISSSYSNKWNVEEAPGLYEIYASTAENINKYLFNVVHESRALFDVMGAVTLAIDEAKKCFGIIQVPSASSVPTHVIRSSVENNQQTNNSHNINSVKIRNKLMDVNSLINNGKVNDFGFCFNSECNNIPVQQASTSSEQVSSPFDAELFEVQPNDPLMFEASLSPKVSSEKQTSSLALSSEDDFPWGVSNNEVDPDFLLPPTLEEFWEEDYYSSLYAQTQSSLNAPVSTLASSNPMDVEVVTPPVVDSDNNQGQRLFVTPITSKTSSIPTLQASALSAQAPSPFDAQRFEFEEEPESPKVSPEQQTSSSQSASPDGDLPWGESNNEADADTLLTPAPEELWGLESN